MEVRSHFVDASIMLLLFHCHNSHYNVYFILRYLHNRAGITALLAALADKEGSVRFAM